jgi:hypothetical protein
MGVDTGDRLGRYEVIAALGAGGMGEVYPSEATWLERKVPPRGSRLPEAGTRGSPTQARCKGGLK